MEHGFEAYSTNCPLWERPDVEPEVQYSLVS